MMFKSRSVSMVSTFLAIASTTVASQSLATPAIVGEYEFASCDVDGGTLTMNLLASKDGEQFQIKGIKAWFPRGGQIANVSADVRYIGYNLSVTIVDGSYGAKHDYRMNLSNPSLSGAPGAASDLPILDVGFVNDGTAGTLALQSLDLGTDTHSSLPCAFKNLQILEKSGAGAWGASDDAR